MVGNRSFGALPPPTLTAAHEIFMIMQDYGAGPNLFDSIPLILSIVRRARPIIGGALPANRSLRRRVATYARAVRR